MSSVLNDTSAKFNNIDFNFNIDSGDGRVDVFKIHNDFSNNIQHILDSLPGSEAHINLSPLKNKENYK